MRDFYPATVHARFVAALVFAGLFAAQIGPWQLLIFAAVDLIVALWTRLAIKRHGEIPANARD